MSEIIGTPCDQIKYFLTEEDMENIKSHYLNEGAKSVHEQIESCGFRLCVEGPEYGEGCYLEGIIGREKSITYCRLLDKMNEIEIYYKGDIRIFRDHQKDIEWRIVYFSTKNDVDEGLDEIIEISRKSFGECLDGLFNCLLK